MQYIDLLFGSIHILQNVKNTVHQVSYNSCKKGVGGGGVVTYLSGHGIFYVDVSFERRE